MKVVIAGSRAITDVRWLLEAIDESGFNITEVVSGTARGVDRMGEAYGQGRGVPVTRFPANWKLGISAGFLRNQQMAEYAEALIAIWDGKSKGTAHMVRFMRDACRKPVFVKVVSADGSK